VGTAGKTDTHRQTHLDGNTHTWLTLSKAPLLGKMAEFLESTDMVCWKRRRQDILVHLFSLLIVS